MSDKFDFKGATADQAKSWFADIGQPSYRASQVRSWIFERGVDDFAQMTNLSKDLRVKLGQEVSLTRLSEVRRSESSDGSIKFLFRLADGRTIETVYIPERTRATVCISTQVGCKLACRFCLTGATGHVRNLTAGEIVDQVIQTKRAAPDNKITNIVLMGMGEPLDNYDAVTQAIEVITEPAASLVGARKITLSTAGVAPAIERLARSRPGVKLAISLNATTNEVRDELMPINRKYPIEKLLDALAAWPLPQGRRITFEYVLLAGINDSDEDAHRLHKITKDVASKINLIPVNPCPGLLYQRPSDERIEAFKAILDGYERVVIVRTSRGADIMAACGQLREDNCFGIEK